MILFAIFNQEKGPSQSPDNDHRAFLGVTSNCYTKTTEVGHFMASNPTSAYITALQLAKVSVYLDAHN